MGTLTTTSHALALSRDNEDSPLWRAAILLLRPLHLGLAFPSILYVAVMTVFLLIMGYSFTLTLFISHQPSMVHVFFQMFVLFMLTAPLITMRLLAMTHHGHRRPATRTTNGRHRRTVDLLGLTAIATDITTGTGTPLSRLATKLSCWQVSTLSPWLQFLDRQPVQGM